MTAPNILVIEDNIETAKNIKLYLEHNQLCCDLVHSGTEGVEAFFAKQYDLVILDRMLPDLNGVAVCEKIRKESDIPIIMLTAKITDNDLIDGLGAGADEYVKKPYSNKELVARVKAHLRRSESNNNSVNRGNQSSQNIGYYVLNSKACTIKSNEKELALTKTEYLIFEKLLNFPGQVFSREQLFLCAFDSSHESIDRTVDVHLHNLRAKINKSGVEQHGIKSVYGLGYKLDIS